MGLVNLTSDLAIGAGNPLGSPTGNNLGQPTSLGGYSHPGPVDYFPNLNATGFTLNFSGPPTLFTMNGVPEVVNTNPIGRHTSGLDVPSFNLSDVTTLQQQIIPFEQSDVTSFQQENNPFNLSDITSLERPEMIEWFNVTTDNSPNADRSPRQPFNFPSLETPEVFNSYNNSGTINTELSTEGQYDKLPYRDNNVIGFDQPFIIKDIGSKAGLDAVSGIPGIGMASTMIGRTVDDVKRIGKFILTPQGLTFGIKQFLFYKLNPFEHTRQWNPLGLVSIVPMVHAESHGSMSNSLTAALEPIGPLIDKLKGVAGKAGEAGASAGSALVNLLGSAAKSTIEFGGDLKDFGTTTFSKTSTTLAPILDRFRVMFPHREQAATFEAPEGTIQSGDGGGIKFDWTKVKTTADKVWSKGKDLTITIGKGALSVGQKAYAGVGWIGGHIGDISWARELHSGAYTRYQDSLAIIMRGQAQGPGTPMNAQSGFSFAGGGEGLGGSGIGNKDENGEVNWPPPFWHNIWGSDVITTGALSSGTAEAQQRTREGKYHPNLIQPDDRPDGTSTLSVYLLRGMMWKHYSNGEAGRASHTDRWPAVAVMGGRYFSITDSKMNAVPEWSRPSDIIKPTIDEDDKNRLLIPQPPSVVQQDTLRNYAMSAYGDLPGETNARDDIIYEKTLKTPAESKVSKYADLDSDEKNRELRKRGRDIMYSVGQPGTPGILPVWDDKIKGLIKKGHTGKYVNELTDKVNMTPYGQDSDFDFIPFKFKDLVNNKYLVFRATLEGISDTVTPNWNESQYIGRPDKVYTYGGADRAIGFSFKIFPNTKQEMILLWDKVNYLMGLGYPAWKQGGETGGRLMTPPFVELTIGNLYKDTPGLIDSIGVTVEDSGGWDIDVPLQLPKFLTIQIGFKFIGNYALSMTGKHFDLPWLDGTKPYENFLTDPSNNENIPPVDASQGTGDIIKESSGWSTNYQEEGIQPTAAPEG